MRRLSLNSMNHIHRGVKLFWLSLVSREVYRVGTHQIWLPLRVYVPGLANIDLWTMIVWIILSVPGWLWTTVYTRINTETLPVSFLESTKIDCIQNTDLILAISCNCTAFGCFLYYDFLYFLMTIAMRETLVPKNTARSNRATHRILDLNHQHS